MECNDRTAMIAVAADGALDPVRKAQLDAHLGACPRCRAALADQRVVRSVLASTPPAVASADFLARVNARIDDAAGWFGLTDFRAWTFRLIPAAAALTLMAFVGSPSTRPARPGSSAIAANFSPASAGDWQRDVTADALLDAALRAATGELHVR